MQGTLLSRRHPQMFFPSPAAITFSLRLLLSGLLVSITLHLQGCEEKCKPGDPCEMKALCHTCCDDDPWDPDPACSNETTAPCPLGETQNQICHSWCDKNCPDAISGALHKGVCIAPAREAARDETEGQFGRVHEDRIKTVRLRGGRKETNASLNESVKLNASLNFLDCMWRQTGSCNPHGAREPDLDRPCNALVEPGLSGFCECRNRDGNGSIVESRAYETTCAGKFSFTCQLVCGGGDDNLCKWRQTGGCDPKGAREPQHDKPCGASIQPGASGYCECGDQRTHETTCSSKEAFTCLEACSLLTVDESEL